MEKTEYKDALLCYHVRREKSYYLLKEDFLPVAAYIKDEKIIDTMWKSFIFLPSPSYLYDRCGKKLLSQRMCMQYIYKEELAPDMNIDALEMAVEEIKQTLGLDNYKVEVYMSLFAPIAKNYDFGIVDGRMLNFKSLNDRTDALKWMVDESIKGFNEKNYKNVKLAGFYWYDEEILFQEKEDKLLNMLNDYIHSKGMLSCWSPYCLATGYDVWDKLGFDFAAHQPNYFSEHLKHLANRGTNERLKLVADIHNETNLGISIELADVEFEDITVLKEYFKAGVKMGFMKNTNHVYYYLNHFLSLVNTDNDYYKSAYDETYKFIKGTLKEEDIYFEY